MFVLAAAILLVGCANSFNAFYEPEPPPITGLVPYTGEPKLLIGKSGPEATVLQMYTDGYGLIGYSAFRGPVQNRKGAIAQARKVGAAIIVFRQLGNDAASGTDSFDLRGSGGEVSTNQTQVALYFAPLERRRLGIAAVPLTPRQRQEIGLSQGMRVIAVRNESPGFLAGVHLGDYVLTFGGKPLHDRSSLNAAVTQAIGKKSELVLIRDGRRISKSIMIPAAGW